MRPSDFFAAPNNMEYEFWCGKDLPAEVDYLLMLMNSFKRAYNIRVILHPQESRSVFWLGDFESYTPRPLSKPVSELVLFTSGTTGAPKRIIKSNFGQFLADKKGKGSPDDIWLLTYNPYRWAGITLLSHIIKHDSRLLVPHSLSPEDIVDAAAIGATHMSLTPSLFKKILIQVPRERLQGLGFKQITFGGETASQSVLDEAKALFPNARISHTYASTEFGDVCSASDGLAGFHESKFEKYSFVDNELIINGIHTDDLWEKKGDRYYFVGRKQEMVNVGGHKISLQYIDETASNVKGVAQACSRATPSPLLGSVIVLDYVGSIEPKELKAQLRQVLPKVACPAQVNRVSEIKLTSAGKRKR